MDTSERNSSWPSDGALIKRLDYLMGLARLAVTKRAKRRARRTNVSNLKLAGSVPSPGVSSHQAPISPTATSATAATPPMPSGGLIGTTGGNAEAAAAALTVFTDAAPSAPSESKDHTPSESKVAWDGSDFDPAATAGVVNELLNEWLIRGLRAMPNAQHQR